jgi:hypothetical protein
MKTLQLTTLGVLAILGSLPAVAQGLPPGTMQPVYGSVWAAKQREARDAQALASAQAQAAQTATREATQGNIQVSSTTVRHR